MDKHHRKPRSLNGKKNAANISEVNTVQHRAWHTLFENKTPQEIAKIINTIWLDPSYKLYCVKVRP